MRDWDYPIVYRSNVVIGFRDAAYRFGSRVSLGRCFLAISGNLRFDFGIPIVSRGGGSGIFPPVFPPAGVGRGSYDVVFGGFARNPHASSGSPRSFLLRVHGGFWMRRTFRAREFRYGALLGRFLETQ